MEAKVEPLLAPNATMWEYTSIFYNATWSMMGKPPQKRPEGIREKAVELYDIADRYMLAAYWNIKWIAQTYANNSPCPFWRQGSCQYNETLAWEFCSIEEKLDQGSAALHEMFEPIKFYMLKLSRVDALDEFSQIFHVFIPISRIYDRRNIPVYGGLAAQIYLDTLRELHGMLDRPYSQMNHMREAVSDTFGYFCRSERIRIDLEGDAWPFHGDSSRQLAYLLDSSEFWHYIPDDLNILHRRHPLLCGLWLHLFRMHFHKAATSLINPKATVLPMCHFYHTMGQEGLLAQNKDWRDLDLVTEMLETETVFLGSLSSSFEYCFRNDDAMEMRPNKLTKFKELGQVSNLFTDRFSYQHSFTSAEVNTMLCKSDWYQGVTGGTRAYGRITQSGLLQQLELVLRSEVSELNFDYFAMHEFCWQAWNDIWLPIEPCLERLLEQHGHDALNSLGKTIRYIFLGAVHASPDSPTPTSPDQEHLPSTPSEIASGSGSDRRQTHLASP